MFTIEVWGKISLNKFWSWYCKTWAFSKISLRALYQTFPLDQIHLPLIFVQVWHIFSVAFHFMFMILVVSTKTFTKFQTIPMKSEFLKIKIKIVFSLQTKMTEERQRVNFRAVVINRCKIFRMHQDSLWNRFWD